MFSKETNVLLQKSLAVLPWLVCQRSLKRDIDDLAAAALPVKSLAAVDDRHTAEAFGNHIFQALKGRFNAVHMTLDNPVADREAVETLRRKADHCDALVAVGSGTINDLCKYASFLDGKPYIVFPTAASMNGYLSANASISVDGYKKTFAAHMPKALFCDMSVIAAAPARLNKSGLGDSLARSTAQADWLLSHLLLDTAYDETPFNLLKPLEPHLHEQARGIARGDPQSLELLMQVLLLSGLGMTIARGSYPASQGEHMIAHAYSMLFPPPEGGRVREGVVFHGEEIGITTLFMARLQEELLKRAPAMEITIALNEKFGRVPSPIGGGLEPAPGLTRGWGQELEMPCLTCPPPNLPPTGGGTARYFVTGYNFPNEEITAAFGKRVAGEAEKSYAVKRDLIERKMDSRLRGNDGAWEAIAERIEPVMIPSAEIHAILKAAECPDAPQSLGWDAEPYKTAITYARFLRDRFTFLDLVID